MCSALADLRRAALARGRNRLIVGPSSAVTAFTYRSSPTSSWLCSALATADSSSLLQSLRDRALRVREDSACVLDALAANVVADEPRLAGRRADVLGLRANDRQRLAGSMPCARAPRRAPASSPSNRTWRLPPWRAPPQQPSPWSARRRLRLLPRPQPRLRRLGIVDAQPRRASALGSRASPALLPRLRSSDGSATRSRAVLRRGRVLRSVSRVGDVRGLRCLSGSSPASSSGSSSSSLIASYPSPHDRGRDAWARTRRACDRPSTRDEDRDVLTPVVDGDRVADHLREDRRCPRPRLHHPLLARGVHRLDPRHQPLLDERALLA